jgi:hypothetical protein
MCPPKRPRTRISKRVIDVDLTDDWNSGLLEAYGGLLVACAQLEWQLFIVAKRKDGRELLKWLEDNPDQRFSSDACFLERHCKDEPVLLRAVGRARKLWERRNGYVHAVWCRYEGVPVRRHNFRNHLLSESAIRRLVEEVREVRDRLEQLG